MTEDGKVVKLAKDRSSSAQSPSHMLAVPSKAERVEFLTGSSLRAFLQELDIVDDIMTLNVGRMGKGASESSENLKKIGEPLSLRDRKAAEQAVDRFLADVDIAAEDVVSQLKKELAAANIDLPDLSKRYPLAPEQQEGYGKILMTRSTQLREKWDEHLGPFVNQPFQMQYAFEYLRWRGREPIDQILGASMLPRLVSSFEQFLGALLRTTLTIHPAALGPYGDVPFEVTKRYRTIDDIHRYMVDRKVDSFLKESPEHWAKHIRKSPGIEIQSLAWDRTREAIQRRHALIHNAGIADDEYIARVPRNIAAVKVGDKLRCDANYMPEVLLSLRYVAIQLGLQWAWKLGRVPPVQTYPVVINDIVDHFEGNGLWREAQELAEVCLSMDIPNQDGLDILKVNRWLSIQQQGHMGDTIPEIRAWEPARKAQQVAKAALLREYEECARLLKEILMGPRVTQMRRWYKEQPLMVRAMAEEPRIGRLLGNISRKGKSSKRRK